MVSGPYRPEKPRRPERVAPTYNTVLHREAPHADQELLRRQFETALLKAGARGSGLPTEGNRSAQSKAATGLVEGLAVSHHQSDLQAGRTTSVAASILRTNETGRETGREADRKTGRVPSLNEASVWRAGGQAPEKPALKPAAQSVQAGLKTESTSETNQIGKGSVPETNSVTRPDIRPGGRPGGRPDTGPVTRSGTQSSTRAGGQADNQQDKSSSVAQVNVIPPDQALSGVNNSEFQLARVKKATAKNPAVKNPGAAEPDVGESGAEEVIATIKSADPVHRASLKKRTTDEDTPDNSAPPELLASVNMPPLPQVPVTASATSVTSTIDNAGRFETVELMWNHLSAMDARSGPREWHFQIQNDNSALVAVTMTPGSDAGWVVTVASCPEGASAAQACLEELEERFRLAGNKVESLRLRQEQTL